MKKILLSIFLLVSVSQVSAFENCIAGTPYAEGNYANSILINAQNLYGATLEQADPPPKQPCGAEFETSGDATHKGPLSDDQAMFMVQQAYDRAKNNAEAFCRVFGEKDCKNVKFIQYTEYDFDSKVVDDELVSTLKIKVKWKCVK